MQKKNLFNGTIILGLGGILAKLLGFFFRIPLIYMIGEEGIGLYQLTYPLYSFLLAICAGIPIAISKLISECIALNKHGEAKGVFKIAIYILGIFGGISSIIMILFSRQIINGLKWNENAIYSLMGISLAPFFTCLLSAFKGYFQGYQFMTIPAISQVIEQLIRVFCGVGLAYVLLFKGIEFSAGGASLGATFGSIGGLIWMLYCYKKYQNPIKVHKDKLNYKKLTYKIFKLAIPISLGQAIGSVMVLIDSVLVPRMLIASGYSQQLATRLYGQLTGKAFVLVNIPLTLSIALAQTIVPAISENFAMKSRLRLESNIKMAYKLSMILALPCAGGLFTLSKPILKLVFAGEGEGWQLMQILAIASIFIIIAQSSTSILNGIGKVMLPVIAICIGSVIKIIISILFIPNPVINISAAAYGTLLAYIIAAFIDAIFVVKSTKMKINIIEVFVAPAFCTAIMIFTVVFSYTYIDKIYQNNAMSVICSIIIGAVVYFIMLIVTKTLRFEEMKRIIGK